MQSAYNSAHSSQLTAHSSFILSRKPCIRDDWSHETLASGYVLSWHKKLDVTFNTAKTAILVGFAWQTLKDKESPQTFITNLPEKFDDNTVLDEEKNWCGKYILLLGGEIFTDAVDLLGVYYSAENVSNNLALMCEVEGRELVFPKLAHGLGPNYIPGVYTEYEGIKRLLPSQVLNYSEGSVRVRKLLPDGVFEGLSEEERTELFIERFSESLRKMREYFSGREVWLALTGGKDSRTTMSILERAGVEYRAFSFGYYGIAEGDVKVPPMLVKAVGKEHVFIGQDSGKYSAQRAWSYTLNCAGMADEMDKVFYAYDQFGGIPAKTGEILMLRSGIYECAVPGYFKDLSVVLNKYADGKASAEDVLRGYGITQYNPTFSKALNEWLGYVREDKINCELEIDSRFYLELRAGCWLSETEQALNIIDGVISVQVMNCRALISLILGYDSELRKDKKHQVLITRTACPTLGDIPYADSFTAGKRYTKLQRLAQFRKFYGLPMTAKYILDKLTRKIFR